MNWLRKLFGVKKCATLAELVDYVPVGDLKFLCNWLDWWIPWRKDKAAPDNFRPVEQVLHRAAFGRGDDCEGTHATAYKVMSSEKWKAAGWKAALVALDKSDSPGHAICIFIMPDGRKGYINYKPFIFPSPPLVVNGVHTMHRAAEWGEVFKTVAGNWTQARWVNEEGHLLPIAGWKARDI